MQVETAKAPAYEATQEYKDILARHKAVVDKGEIALLELIPAAKNDKGQPVSFGGFSVMGKIRDKYKNLVLDTKLMEDRVGIAPMGISLRYNEPDNLRFIYAILNCPILRGQCVLSNETPIKHQHRFILVDAEKESTEYALKREEAIKYQNTFYTLTEESINLLCTLAGIPTSASLGVKRADLCKVWENDLDKRKLIKNMVDNPDIAYYELAYMELEAGKKANDGTGFYKTPSGVYKHNEQIIGNSIDNVIAYLKQNDEIVTAIKKSKEPAKPVVAKPK